mmetsp:Transcript_118117/g.280440  ORF Transcript_118117/g.280440 Transcript_118117/m.280440 type:complete len:246 (-) Transcript_118117:334-1071(-)
MGCHLCRLVILDGSLQVRACLLVPLLLKQNLAVPEESQAFLRLELQHVCEVAACTIEVSHEPQQQRTAHQKLDQERPELLWLVCHELVVLPLTRLLIEGAVGTTALVWKAILLGQRLLDGVLAAISLALATVAVALGVFTAPLLLLPALPLHGLGGVADCTAILAQRLGAVPQAPQRVCQATTGNQMHRLILQHLPEVSTCPFKVLNLEAQLSPCKQRRLEVGEVTKAAIQVANGAVQVARSLQG